MLLDFLPCRDRTIIQFLGRVCEDDLAQGTVDSAYVGELSWFLKYRIFTEETPAGSVAKPYTFQGELSARDIGKA